MAQRELGQDWNCPTHEENEDMHTLGCASLREQYIFPNKAKDLEADRWPEIEVEVPH